MTHAQEGKMREKQPWYKRWWVLVLAGLIVFAIGAGAGGDDEPEVEAVATTTTEATTTTQPPTTTTTEQTGDWSSDTAYRLDVADTADKLELLFTTLGEVSTDLANGVYSFDTGAALVTEAQVALRTHIDHFDGTTAPSGYATTHSLMIQALDAYDDSFGLFIRGLEQADIDLLTEAEVKMTEGNTLIDQATAAMP